ncbi:LysR family transcriptional regulator [Desulfatibacillum aliphaticivorans]|uniref:winged helix-turn-helix domain-containing protein n=1 Tax=Desulfatibacillum aliphaticivorans TaxID=218208 RepID=UPI00055269D9
MLVGDKKFQVRSKIWVQDDEGNVVFGLGRLRILEAIQKTGSLRAAAQELGMGYRAIWARIRATEERLGVPVLEKKQGGRSGGGSFLTPFAEKLLEDFKSMQRKVEKETDKTFAKSFEENLDEHTRENN